MRMHEGCHRFVPVPICCSIMFSGSGAVKVAFTAVAQQMGNYYMPHLCSLNFW